MTGEDIGELEEPPVILRAMRLVCKNFLPGWNMLRIPEFTNFVFDHLDELLDPCKRKAQFVDSIQEWVKGEHAKNRKSSQRRGMKKSEIDIDEVEAMEDLVAILSADDSCSDLKAEAKEWIVFCGKYSWIEQSNWNPSLECNERIILKFLDYLYSPTGRKAKLDLGETVLRGRMKRMADLGVIEDEETARTKVRHSYS